MRSKRPQKKPLVRQFPKGRVCKKHGCKHVLSIYNSELYCRIHLSEVQNH